MADIKLQLYNFLVNKNSGIRKNYHRLHDGADRNGKIKSYASLLGMNAQYYLLGKRDFGGSLDTGYYEEKELKVLSESAAHKGRYPELVKGYREALASDNLDVISFDVFDTLLLRPFSAPTDIFFFLGRKLGIMDFKRIRIQQELLARREHEKKYGNNEVTFAEIWERIEREVGVPAKTGMKAELKAEEKFCFANPFMLDAFNSLKKQGKTIIAVSDMYLPSDFVKALLEKNGFTGIKKIYMSCEYGKSKSKGDLYDLVKRDISRSAILSKSKGSLRGIHTENSLHRSTALRILHIGDNEHSDVKKASEAGITPLYYPNVNAVGRKVRAYDMSPIIGGAYRGIVNARLFNGPKKYHPEYEYGYIYGGLLVLGYCSFIHRYCSLNGVDRILFLSRDGDIIKQVYDFLYPGENTQYTYISRSVVTKLMRNHNRYDFFLRFADKMINQGLTIGEILAKMGLKASFASTGDGLDKRSGVAAAFAFNNIDISKQLTDRNVGEFKEFLNKSFSFIDKELADLDKAAKVYYTSVLSGSKKAAVVDIGWAGSAAASLSVLASKEWELSTEIIGLVAGTNTLHCSEPDAAEEFLQSGMLVPYAFSQSLNRDIMKKHDPNKNYNVYWELLFSSPTRQLTGMSLSADACDKGIDINGQSVGFSFGGKEYNTKGIKRIQKGIMDFVHDYHAHFKDYPYMFDISGRDAAAPMLLAASHDESYLKKIAKRFDIKIDV